jgi:uncharacterized protein (TIGR00369 family)
MQNADHALIHRFTRGAEPLAIDSNPLFVALAARLLDVDREGGTVALAFAPGVAFVQGAGFIQGGVVCAMLDFAMAFAVMARLTANEAATTVNVNVSFLRATRPGELRATGSLDRLGNSMAFTRATLHAADGALLATASSTLAVLR